MKSIVEKLAEQFDASPEFVRVILTKHNLVGSLPGTDTDIDAFAKLAGNSWKYVAYALGTNQRAKASLARMLSIAGPDRVGKALDVGCGYGGFMNAFMERGFTAYGVEIDRHLAALARVNLGESNEDAAVYVGDLFSGDLALGKFDLITVNDVIEHLPNPIGAFSSLAAMLNPGGVLGIYAPNGRSIFYASEDPHNRVFGSSILPGPLARTYVQAVLNSTGYSLGEYLGIDVFRDLCDRENLRFHHLPHDGGERPERAADYLSQFIAAFRNSDLHSKVPALVARSVEIAIWGYVAEYAGAASRATAGTGYCEFMGTYLSRAWTIVCKKRGGGDR